MPGHFGKGLLETLRPVLLVAARSKRNGPGNVSPKQIGAGIAMVLACLWQVVAILVWCLYNVQNFQDNIQSKLFRHLPTNLKACGPSPAWNVSWKWWCLTWWLPLTLPSNEWACVSPPWRKAATKPAARERSWILGKATPVTSSDLLHILVYNFKLGYGKMNEIWFSFSLLKSLSAFAASPTSSDTFHQTHRTRQGSQPIFIRFSLCH